MSYWLLLNFCLCFYTFVVFCCAPDCKPCFPFWINNKKKWLNWTEFLNDICPFFRIRIVHFILTHTVIHSGGEKGLVYYKFRCPSGNLSRSVMFLFSPVILSREFAWSYEDEGLWSKVLLTWGKNPNIKFKPCSFCCTYGLTKSTTACNIVGLSGGIVAKSYLPQISLLDWALKIVWIKTENRINTYSCWRHLTLLSTVKSLCFNTAAKVFCFSWELLKLWSETWYWP